LACNKIRCGQPTLQRDNSDAMIRAHSKGSRSENSGYAESRTQCFSTSMRLRIAFSPRVQFDFLVAFSS